MLSNNVSVIVPVYNGERYIHRCIDSLINQTYRNIEIILVNDGSSDNSENIIHEYAERDSRIKLYNQKNQGVSVARNVGLNKANGKYVMFVDADDYIELNMVAEMVNKIQYENTIVFCDNTEIWAKSTDIRKLFVGLSEDNLSKEIVLREIASGRAGLVCGKLFDREIVVAHNIRFDSNVKVCEDQLFFLEIVILCEHFIHVPQALYHYDRRNENSATIKYQANALENQLYVLKSIGCILSKSSLRIEDIKSILSKRTWDALLLCVNNEVFHTSLSNISKRKRKIKDIISNEVFKRVVFNTYSTDIRTRIIKIGFKAKSAIFILCSFFILDRIVFPIRKIFFQ